MLELAEDTSLPLLERVKFLAIYASNLDEFYMVRVAGLHDQVDAGIDARGPDGLSPGETIERIAERARELGERHSRQWDQAIAPELNEHGIRVIDCAGCDAEELDAIDRRFWDQIFPALTPLAVGPDGRSRTSRTCRCPWPCGCAIPYRAPTASRASRCPRRCCRASCPSRTGCSSRSRA